MLTPWNVFFASHHKTTIVASHAIEHRGQEEAIKKVKISQLVFHVAKVQNNFDIFELLEKIMKTIMKKVLFIALLTIVIAMPLTIQGQVSAERKVRFGIIVDGDTIPYYRLNEVKVIESASLLTDKEIRKNQKLIRNVKKMLPYAKIGKQRLDELESRIADMPKRERKAAIKEAEKELLADFSDELKACTISQGMVLLKLIDRETGRTSYVLVDELRGKIRAGFYQTFARLFGYNLKATYDPRHNKEDNLIERIVLSIERGKL